MEDNTKNINEGSINTNNNEGENNSSTQKEYESLECRININDFDGPFDLLLALVKEKKMDIMTLDLVVIAKQYVEFVNKNLSKLKIDDMTEYLLMASYLLELKSKKVLPVIDTVEKMEKEIERDKFIQRLLVYKQYQNIVPKLVEKLEARYKMHEKESNNFEEYLNSEETEVFLPENLDVQNILRAMQKVYVRLQGRKNLADIKTIEITEVSIDDVEKDIHQYFQPFEYGYKISLTDYLSQLPLEKFTKQYFVVTFVALLVLVRNQFLLLQQEVYPNDEIYIIKKHPEED